MSDTENPQWSEPDELGYIRENGRPILRLLGGMNAPDVIARGQFLLTAANAHDDLVVALKAMRAAVGAVFEAWNDQDDWNRNKLFTAITSTLGEAEEQAVLALAKAGATP